MLAIFIVISQLWSIFSFRNITHIVGKTQVPVWQSQQNSGRLGSIQPGSGSCNTLGSFIFFLSYEVLIFLSAIIDYPVNLGCSRCFIRISYHWHPLYPSPFLQLQSTQTHFLINNIFCTNSCNWIILLICMSLLQNISAQTVEPLYTLLFV